MRAGWREDCKDNGGRKRMELLIREGTGKLAEKWEVGSGKMAGGDGGEFEIGS